MKGFLARNQQALAIAASAAVLVAVAGTLTGIILAGRSGTPTAARQTPSPSFDTGAPTPFGSVTPSASASARASAGASASAKAGASSSTSSTNGSGGTAAPIFGGGSTPNCVVVACPGGPVATPTPAPPPAVTATYSEAALTPGHAALATALAPDGATVWFSEGGSSGTLGRISASSSLTETQVSGLVDPLALKFDGAGNLWVVDGNTNTPAIVELGKDSVASGAPTVLKSFPLNKSAEKLSPTAPQAQALQGLSFDSKNNLWFSESTIGGLPALGEVPSGTGTGTAPALCILRLPSGQYAGTPSAMLTGTDGRLYIASSNGLGVLSAFPSGACNASGVPNYTYKEYQPIAPASCSSNPAQVQSIALGTNVDNKVWFGTSGGVGNFDPTSSNPVAIIQACNTASGMSGDHLGLVAAPDPSQPGKSAMWAAFSSSGSGLDRIYNAVGTASPDTSKTHGDLRSLVRDNAGNLWMADSSGTMVKAVPAKG